MIMQRLKTLQTLFLILAILSFNCSAEVVNEKWIGYYSFPSSDIEFPLHISIQIRGTQVSGTAMDGNMEEATVSGTVVSNVYDLLLHPIKHGENKNQDVRYKGKRSGDEIAGEWIHIVGPRGPWISRLTDLNAEEAIKVKQEPCKRAHLAKSNECDNDA